MATNFPTISTNNNDNENNYVNNDIFIQQIENARISIQYVFGNLMEKVQQREEELLKQLEDFKSDYDFNNQERQVALDALKAQLESTSQNLRLNDLKEFQLQQVEQLNQMISKLEMEDGEERRISWSWDSQLIEAITAVGKLEVITEVKEEQEVKRTVIDYKDNEKQQNSLVHFEQIDNKEERQKLASIKINNEEQQMPSPIESNNEEQQKPIMINYKLKLKPVIRKCKYGIKDSESKLQDPFAVAVDINTGNIFVSDRGTANHCIKVYISNGDFLFKFGDKLKFPRNICIHKGRFFVTHNHGVVIFNLDGKVLNKFGTFGITIEGFNCAWGILISPLNSDIYICDSNNHRIQIYDSKNFKYKSTFGNDSLKYPKEIKFAENEYYILDQNNPCIHVYTTEHIYIRSLISKGPDKQVTFSNFFHIDNSCNLLLTDEKRHCLHVFNNRGELLHQIGGGESSDMFEPCGVATDKDGRIIVVNYKPNDKLLIY